MAHVERPMMTVSVVLAEAPRALVSATVQLPCGATVRDAVNACAELRAGLAQAGPGRHLSLWGRLCGPDTVLQDHDRLALLRPLLIDPMEARRQRLAREGLRKVRRSPRVPKAG